MKVILLYILLVLLGCHAEEEAIEQAYFPNIGYLGRGYNVYFGNPLSTSYGGDPGFKDTIFDMSDRSGETTGDYQFYLPTGVTSDLCVLCNLDDNYNEYDSTEKYKQDLEQYVKFSAGFAGVGFSASTTWRDMYQYTSSDQYIVTETKLQCSYYCATLKIERPVGKAPKMKQDFIDWMEWLPETYDEAEYKDFIHAYGTHVPTRIIFGALYGASYVLTSSDYESLRQSGVKIETAVNVAAYGATASVAWGLDRKEEWQNAFQSKVKKTFSYSIGQAFPKDVQNFAETWQNSAKSSPAPLSIEGKQIDYLVSSRFFPTWTSSRIENIKRNIQTYLSGYCSYLVSQKLLTGVKADCTLIPDPIAPPPAPTVTCRYCSSCGGAYSNDEGQLVHNGDWGPYNMYGRGCGGYLTKMWDEPHLCCTPDQSETGCTLCATSCGGAYPHEAGRRLNEGDYGYWKTRGTGCNGDSRSLNSLRETVLCCKTTKSNCKWCESCGTGMSENGRKVNEGDWGSWRVYERNLCNAGVSGAITGTGRSYWDEVALCCKA